MALVVARNKEIASLIHKANHTERIAEKFQTWKSGSLMGICDLCGSIKFYAVRWLKGIEGAVFWRKLFQTVP